MRIAGIRDLRARTADYLGGEEPLLVTKHGRISGIFVPITPSDRVPQDLRFELARVVGDHLSRLLDARGVTDDDIERDFDEFRRERRRRR
ncbi:MAG: hypothetical protein SF066_18055 [Thermoanaerobaculia bacterium]|nr:hypothetical protein [Thermoanaerobaculia bacterium]